MLALVLLMAVGSAATSEELLRSLKSIHHNYLNNENLLLFTSQELPEETPKTLDVINNSQVEDIIREVYTWEMAVLLVNGSGSIPLLVPGIDAIIVVENDSIRDFANSIKKQLRRSFRRILVVLFCESVLSEKDMIRAIIRDARKSCGCVNVTVMVVRPKLISFHTWFPYRRGECLNVSTLVLLDSWINGSFVEGNNLFPVKIPRKFNDCPIKFTAKYMQPYVLRMNETFDGYEARIFDYLVKYFQFQFSYIYLDPNETIWDVCSSDGKLLGVFKRLAEYKVDIAFGGLPLRTERYLSSDALFPHLQEKLMWVVPAPRVQSNFQAIYSVFSSSLWYHIIVYHLYVVLSFYIIARYQTQEPDIFRNIIYCFFITTSVLFNGAIGVRPKERYLRFVFLCYVMYSLLISAAYQSQLVAGLTDIRREEPYETVEELLDNGMYGYLTAPTSVFFNQTDHDLWNRLLQPQNHRLDFDINQALDDLAFNKSAFLLFPKSSMEFVSSDNYNKVAGRTLFRYLPQPFLTYGTSFYLSPGSPIRDIWEKKIFRLIESGIFRYWKKAVNKRHGMTPVLSVSEEDEANNKKQSLSLRHMEGVFILLIIALLISIFTFFTEVVYHKMKNKMKRRKIM